MRAGIDLELGRDEQGYDYQVGPKSTATVEPGATVIFESWDARAGAVIDHEPGAWFDLPARSPVGRSNPLSGPVAVKGAEPGDSLLVRIVDIRVADRGWCGGRPIVALDADRIPSARAVVCRIEADQVRFSESIAIPLRPMVGCIGTAPGNGPLSSELPGRNGGNMDHNVIRAGTLVHLPVAHSGAFLYLGDVHAAQGDGELSGIGLEIAAETTVTVGVDKETGITWPWAETEDRIMVMVSAPNFPQARREAMECMLRAIQSQLGLDPSAALALIGIAGDIRIGQAVGGSDMTLRLEMPASLGLRPT